MNVITTTRRFVLREFEPPDADLFVAYQTAPDFAMFHLASERGEDHARRVFRLFLDWQLERPRDNYQLAIAALERPANLIGSCGIRQERCAEGEAVFGIELARSYWGRFRYAQEVSEALINWAFDTLQLSALVADTAFENDAVARLAEACGFVRTHADEKQWWRLERSAWHGNIT
ncbi:GNAT family N-acetyltransferase [Massilia sp. METH4]|uniref:GNAT family N-acetyltransferase n=1 Tax=Massilia sp. METH4 TaxID=3123041 RepID=UPI0030D24FAF